MKKRFLAILAVVLAAVKLTSATGGFALVGVKLTSLISSCETAQFLLSAELASPKFSLEPTALLRTTFPQTTPELEPTTAENVPVSNVPQVQPPVQASPPLSPAAQSSEPAPDDPMLIYESGVAARAPEGIDNSAPLSAEGIVIKNNSGLPLDASALLREPLDISLADEGPTVLIIHTHSSESYTKSPGEEFTESDPYRTEDKAYNIIAVGSELADSLAARGISVIHDRSMNDFPSYAGSYGRSLEIAKRYLEEYPSISLVIDLHRDAMETADGSQFKTIADINGELCSQVMLVVGTNGSGLTHPNWPQNMQLALRLQYEMNRSYPTLARPMTVAQHRYNHHVTPGALLVEIGATGNTLEESKAGARYFAEAYANVILAD